MTMKRRGTLSAMRTELTGSSSASGSPVIGGGRSWLTSVVVLSLLAVLSPVPSSAAAFTAVTSSASSRTVPRSTRVPFSTTSSAARAAAAAAASSALRRYYADDPDRHQSDGTVEPPPEYLRIEKERQDWIDRSLKYYSKVMREERRRSIGQAVGYETPKYRDRFALLAKKHYFALRKIKDGKPEHAELIYRRIINELLAEDQEEEGGCDHAKLAVSTLLLALLLQRQKNTKAARSVFLNFFRVVVVDGQQQLNNSREQEHEQPHHHRHGHGGEGSHHQCACSAKVLQAYALFEMKQGNAFKSLELVRKAVELDPALEPVLNWKQFRDTLERRQQWGGGASAQQLRP